MQDKDRRFPTLVAVKLPRELAEEIRRKAREDDRTVSAYIRRLLATQIAQQQR